MVIITKQQEYIRKIVSQLRSFYLPQMLIDQLYEKRNSLFTLLLLNFDPLIPMLESLYAPGNRGGEKQDPAALLRSMVLMTLEHEHSITTWVAKLRGSPLLAVLSGFNPKKVPGVGTFYDLIDRLENGPYQKGKPKISQQRKKWHCREKKKKPQKGEKPPEPNPDVAKKLAKELLENASSCRQEDFLFRLEQMLWLCGVIPSSSRGLLGDLNKLCVAGDSSALESGNSPYGKPICNCRKNGIYNCRCDRLVKDPMANWGFDSYRDCYYFGYRFYHNIVSSKGHELPLNLLIASANETDFTLGLKALDRLDKILKSLDTPFKIYAFIADSGHDAYAHYEYCKQKSIYPVIDLNPRRSDLPKPTGTAQLVNEQGVPLCKAGIPMRFQSTVPQKGRIYYNCPVKRPTQRNGKSDYVAHTQECPLKVLCQPDTKLGPVVYTRSDHDIRLYPGIRRESSEFKQLYKLRSGTERSNSIKKEFFLVQRARCQSNTHFLFRLFLISLLEHVRSWVFEDFGNKGPNREDLLLFMEAQTTV